MIAEVNIFGVFISTGLFAAGIAGLLHIVVRRVLLFIGFYAFVAHQNLLDVSLFIILWGVSTFAISLSTVLS
jgi:hypothetical protein